jgi:transcriptional regulator with XRE-family HTH domain
MARFNTKAFRERHGLTQKQLAEKIPVAVRTVERWEQESGRLYDPSPLAVYRMRAIDTELSGKQSVKRRRVTSDDDSESADFARPSLTRGVLPSVR